MKASWKTTAMGLAAILSALGAAGKALFDGDPSTVFDLETTVVAVTAGVGLMFARDNKVTSEQAGAKS